MCTYMLVVTMKLKEWGKQSNNKFALNVSVESDLSSLHFIQSSRHLFIGIQEREIKKTSSWSWANQKVWVT